LEGNQKKTSSQISSPQNRKGYEAKFLGNDLEINLVDIYKPFLDKNLVAPTIDNGHELHYTHFSLAMHKTRRMCIITGVNIDGNQEKKITREDDKWFLDGRMNTKYQLDNSMYSNNDLDRGHMVRREDPNWGDDAEIANEDTFFYTNACPQHKNLNQREWLALETYVLKNTQTNDLKVSVFTGPVIDENFVPYREGIVPAQFYKIVAMIKKDGKPSVTGYVLSQKEMISGLERVQTDFEFSKFKTYQVSLSKIEEMTTLDLSKMKTFDPLKTEQEGVLKEITNADDLVL
jgi:endonuclease G, mitochondrial